MVYVYIFSFSFKFSDSSLMRKNENETHTHTHTHIIILSIFQGGRSQGMICRALGLLDLFRGAEGKVIFISFIFHYVDICTDGAREMVS